MWPFSKAKRTPPLGSPVLQVTYEQLVSALDIFYSPGVRMALFYANLNGYPHEVIRGNEDLAAFHNAIQSEPTFTPEGIAFATRRLSDDLDIACKAGTFDQLVALTRNVDEPGGEYLLAVKAAVKRLGSRAVFAQLGFDPADWLITATTQLRDADLEAIKAKFEERKVYLRPLLLRAKAQGRTKYGEMDYARYIDEIDEFLRHYFPDERLSFFAMYPPLMYCVRHVESWFESALEGATIPSDPIAFEHWCAAEIERQGWSVRVSRASGDQGVDVEAMRLGLTVAIQCKRYADPIGNKAVQEAHTGAVHYRADLACVIGTGGFTRAAEELARTTGVILLDAKNIAEFTDLISSGR